MIEMKAVEELRSHFYDDLKNIPYFIDTRSNRHKNIWSILQIVIRIISRLSNEQILTDKKIQTYIDQTNECVVLILNSIDDPELEIEISHYILTLLEKYEQMALDMELYEVCSNISRYKKLYTLI